ncbi:putative helicase MOV-10 isoform X2 [Armigeres subalbatus]|uniref:putative helicase MOV-10 isoform X2 n=1 Tax=Armigeres subalbatus TaxID=124917 RepID=UPI002ED361F6
MAAMFRREEQNLLRLRELNNFATCGVAERSEWYHTHNWNRLQTFKEQNDHSEAEVITSRDAIKTDKRESDEMIILEPISLKGDCEQDPLLQIREINDEDEVVVSKTRRKRSKKSKKSSQKAHDSDALSNEVQKRPKKGNNKSKKQRKLSKRSTSKKEFEKVVIDVDVKPVTTLIRFSSKQDECISEDEIRTMCPFCRISYESDVILKEHFRNSHGAVFSLAPLMQMDIRNYIISREVFRVELKQSPYHSTSTFLLTITNTSTITLLLKSAYIFDGHCSLTPVFVEGAVLRMRPGSHYQDELYLQAEGDCFHSILLTANFNEGARLPYDVVEQHHINRKSAKRTRTVGTPLRLRKLNSYNIPTPIKILHANNFKQRGAYGSSELQILRQLQEAKDPFSLNSNNYKKQLSLLNSIEAEHLICKFEQYRIDKPKLKMLTKVKRRNDGSSYDQTLYSLSISQFKIRPSLINEDQYVTLSVKIGDVTKIHKGAVELIEEKDILILFEEANVAVANAISIEFVFNKVTFQLEQQALNCLAQCRKEMILFPTRSNAVQGEQIDKITSLHWININIASNEEQMTAVRSIVNRTSFPAPYVLFGPPGTGKSSTLVEAIAQIYIHRPATNILVVAPSNFAANEITTRILNYVPEKHVFRFFSRMSFRKVDDIDETILQNSNFADKEYDIPYYEDIYHSRIVVTTMITSGRLVQANIKDRHFGYVFLDECGSAKEITAMVSIGGLATCNDEIHASIILAGDPKQLGPVIMYDFLKHTNHKISMLERLMTLDLYTKNRKTIKYDTQYITQLRNNFRSHPMLLNFPNNAFYDGQLRAKASPELTHWALGWHLLPNPKCPLIFHSITGYMKGVEYSFSLVNLEEAALVFDYLNDILTHGINGHQVRQCDIGVISPYAGQVSHLRKLCNTRGWKDVEIGSAEQYQGREKPVIILSTVRSRCTYVGFLSDPRRLNVMITRARALLIVVGHATTLQMNGNWKTFITYCRRNNAFIDKSRSQTAAK